MTLNINPELFENDPTKKLDLSLPGGTKGFVTSLPVNPLFSFKANGQYTYDTDYLLPLIVDSGNIDGATLTTTVSDADDLILPDGFDSLAAGAVVYDTFTVEYTTGEGTTEATVTVKITGVNDAPVAADDTHDAVVASGSSATIDVLGNDSDVDIYDGDSDLVADVLTVTAVSGSTNGGTVTITNDGADVEYTAPIGFIGIDTFTYTVSDGDLTDTGKVTVVVGPANDGPTAVDDTAYSVPEDASLTLFDGTEGVFKNDSDPNGDVLGALLKTDLYLSDENGDPIGLDGSATTEPVTVDIGDIVLSADGTFTYDPESNFNSLAVGESAYVSFEYWAFDGDLVDGVLPDSRDDALVTIEIQGENDAPSGASRTGSVHERGLPTGTQPLTDDEITTIDVLRIGEDDEIKDPDGDTLSLAAGVDENGKATGDDSVQGTYGTLTLNADGTVRYTLTSPVDHNDAKPDTDDFDIYIVDGNGGFGAVDISISISDDFVFLGNNPLANEESDNDISDSTVLQFEKNAFDSDTFDFLQGADGSTLTIDSLPSTFTLYSTPQDGDITVTTTWDNADKQSATGTVSGGDLDGQDLFSLVIDDDASPDGGEWTFKLLQDAPSTLIPLDFGGGVNPGGPEETKEPNNIKFDGGFIEDFDDLGGSWKSAVGDGAYLLNPNNGGGIGVGNGNIDQLEAIAISTVNNQTVSGFTLDVSPVGGGVQNTDPLTLTWEAWNDDTMVFSDSETLTNFTFENPVELFPGMEFDVIYLTFEGLDDNDKVRINNISALQAVEVDDFALTFGLAAEETGPTEDGDVAVAGSSDPAEDYSFTVFVDGTDDNLTYDIA